MWFVILCSCKESYEGKKKAASAPTLVLFQRCHSFKDWSLHTLQKCNAAPWQHVQCSQNVSEYQTVCNSVSACQLIRF